MSEERRLYASIEHVHGPEKIAYGKEELVVVCLVRDGRPYVKAFIEHYRSLGAKHIAFLDNGSTDGTVEILRGYEDVTVLRTSLPYKLEGAPVKDDPVGNGWTREIPFKQYLFSRFGGRDRWCLCADIDELFDYPYSDVIGPDSFLTYLNEGRYTAVAAQMIDMFPEEPLSGKTAGVDEPLKQLHRFCDLSNIDRRGMKGTRGGMKALGSRNTTVASDELEFFGGGIRNTVFGTKPHLTKFPLVFLDGKTKPLDHSAHRVGNATVADITCVLFHYKFVDAHFQKQIAQAVSEEHRMRSSAKYKVYQRVIAENQNLQLKRKNATEVTGVKDLLDHAILVVSDEYVDWVNSEEKKTAADLSDGESDGLIGAHLEARARDRAKTLAAQRLDRRLRDVLKQHSHKVGKLREKTRKSQLRVRELAQRNRVLEQQMEDLRKQMEGLRNSRGWRVLSALYQVRTRASKLVGRGS